MRPDGRDAAGRSRGPPEDQVAAVAGGAMAGVDDCQVRLSCPALVDHQIAPVSEPAAGGQLVQVGWLPGAAAFPV
jgi:hypothetical protein